MSERQRPTLPPRLRAQLFRAGFVIANRIVGTVGLRPFFRPVYHVFVDGWGIALSDVDRTLKRIRRLGEDAWAHAWAETARSYVTLAQQHQSEGHIASTAECYWRAALSFRAADIALGDSLLKRELYAGCAESYRRFAELHSPYVERHTFSDASTTHAGYLHLPPGDGPFPCVIVVHGLGSSKEQPDFRPEALTQRGFAAFVADVAGHGEAFDSSRLTTSSFKIVSVSVDLLQQHPAILPDRIAVLGTSLGGTMALRAASEDPRLRAVVNISGFYEPRHWFEKSARLTEGALRLVTGITDGQALRDLIAQFTLRGSIARITCPILNVHGDADIIIPVDEARLIHAEAAERSTLRIYHGGDHAVLNFPAARFEILDWLTHRLIAAPVAVPA
ncbi:MAG: alpha/beta fold hydrolase [Chloroflexi bacterium]|nr:alpha/beta fold hydrolase [Chloroflexota bacterium]